MTTESTLGGLASTEGLGAGSEARKTWGPVNGIPATWFHGEGAYAQCGYCKRYTLDPAALGDRQPTCECGERYGWSGSFKPPGPTAQWAGGYIRAQVAPGVWANVPRQPEAPNVRGETGPTARTGA